MFIECKVYLIFNNIQKILKPCLNLFKSDIFNIITHKVLSVVFNFFYLKNSDQ